MGEESPILEGDVPLYVLEAAFGLGTEDPKDGSEMNAKDPKLEGDAKSPVYSAGGANWSDVEEGEIVEQEELEKEEPEEEESEEDEELEENEIDLEESEDDQDDLEYDSDEDWDPIPFCVNLMFM